MSDKNQSPLACDMTAIPVEQRPLHLAQLRLSGREGVKEFIREEVSSLTGLTGFS